MLPSLLLLLCQCRVVHDGAFIPILVRLKPVLKQLRDESAVLAAKVEGLR